MLWKFTPNYHVNVRATVRWNQTSHSPQKPQELADLYLHNMHCALQIAGNYGSLPNGTGTAAVAIATAQGSVAFLLVQR